MEFNGFSREAITFLLRLPPDNTIAALPENLAKYRALILEPLTRLYRDVLPAVSAMGEDFVTVPRRCLCTPYTDRRFSPAAPLKEYAYLRFKAGEGRDTPGLYFDIGAQTYSFGLRVYDQTAAGMEKIRQDVLRRPAAYDAALQKLYGCGLALCAVPYRADRFPALPASPAKELLNCRQFYLGSRFSIRETVFSGALAREITDGFLSCAELFRLLKGALIEPTL